MDQPSPVRCRHPGTRPSARESAALVLELTLLQVGDLGPGERGRDVEVSDVLGDLLHVAPPSAPCCPPALREVEATSLRTWATVDNRALSRPTSHPLPHRLVRWQRDSTAGRRPATGCA